MNELTVEKIIEEIRPILLNKKFGKIFRPSKLRFVIDFRLPDSLYLLISAESISPRIYLVKRKLRELEKQSLNPNSFTTLLTKNLSNAVLKNISKEPGERVLRFEFEADSELEGRKIFTLVVQLTGRSANLFLLDERDFIIDSLRENEGDGQTIATVYKPPPVAETQNINAEVFSQGDFATLSEALDSHYEKAERERLVLNRIKSAEAKIKQDISKREKLKKKLKADLENHGDADKWKRLGDLLLANVSNAARVGNTVLVTDYFEDDAPTVEIEVEENLSLTEAAEKFFKRYTKARNAQKELSSRLEKINAEIADLNIQKEQLAKSAESENTEFLQSFSETEEEKSVEKNKSKKNDFFKGARRYKSSDGWEILVGKASKDNDYLTFKIAKSLDFWLHAADYGGSHVVVKNPNRAAEMPQKTLFEAAELAAWFSQAKEQPKVAVNYTQKKFVNKPKGAAAGLVSLSGFKTIMVEPKESLERQP